jgi:hypothetical protein
MIFKGNRVTTERGDILAQKIRGKWETRNPETLAFIAEHENKKKAPKTKTKKVEVEEKLEMVRARDEDGQFLADDPETPEVNEAWVVKTVKKAVKKK